MEPDNSYERWLRTVNEVWKKGWTHVTHEYNHYVFKSPSGSLHDLSAANLDLLDYIEREGKCLICLS